MTPSELSMLRLIYLCASPGETCSYRQFMGMDTPQGERCDTVIARLEASRIISHNYFTIHFNRKKTIQALNGH